MTFSAEQKKQLDAPLVKSNVKTNPRGFDYVEGWHAIAEANRIFGYDAWDRQTLEMRQLGEPEKVDGKWRVAYHCRVRVAVRAGEIGVIRDGSGYGSGINKDIRDAHESAIKEAETDAMKRALMTFGNPFGLALYDKAQANVAEAVSDGLAVIYDIMHAIKNQAELGVWWRKNLENFKAQLSASEQTTLRQAMLAFGKTLPVDEAKAAA